MSSLEASAHGSPEAVCQTCSWLKNRKDPRTLDYLKAENRRTDAALAGLENLRTTLFNELTGRLKEDDVSVPYLHNGYWYHHHNLKGKDYPVYCRRKDEPKAQDAVYLDGNLLAAGEDYFDIGMMEISPDNRWLAYGVDKSGDELYEIRFRDLLTGQDLPYTVQKASYSGAWSADSRSFYYVREDRRRRPHAVYLHTIGTSWRADRCIYREKDPLFYVDVNTSQDGSLIFFTSESKSTTECSYCNSADSDPVPKVIRKRRPGVRYYPDHRNGELIIRCNLQHSNFAILKVEMGANTEDGWEILMPTDSVTDCTDFLVFKNHLVSMESVRGQDRIRIMELESRETHVVSFPGEGYVLEDATNMEFATDQLHLHYSALHVPSRIYRYDMNRRSLELLKEQEVPSGHDPEQYTVQRIWARGADGEEIPATLVYRKDLDVHRPCPTVLTGYGAYGIKEDIGFSIAALSFLNRGCVYVVAHVRGGGFLGENWYNGGKLRRKMNTFRDFIAIAEELIARGFTSARQLVIEGASAGGLLVGAVLNMRPDLFCGAVASVPFVDVLTSMQDEELPLTTFEYEEWGNPADPDDYACIASYSPTDNVTSAAYPQILITVGLQDPRVPYWEGCIWAHKLRLANTGDSEILLRVNLGSGHAGASGRYESLRELAFEQAFLLNLLGLSQS